MPCGLLTQDVEFLQVMLGSRQGCDTVTTGRDKSGLQHAYLQQIAGCKKLFTFL